MNGATTINLFTPFQLWARAVTTLVWYQWQLLDARYDAAVRLLDPGPTPAARPTPGCEPEAPAAPVTVIQRAAERMGQGLPPPREIYDVQNRDRVDWTRFPDWARPSDPELFEGCPHEG